MTGRMFAIVRDAAGLVLFISAAYVALTFWLALAAIALIGAVQ